MKKLLLLFALLLALAPRSWAQRQYLSLPYELPIDSLTGRLKYAGAVPAPAGTEAQHRAWTAKWAAASFNGTDPLPQFASRAGVVLSVTARMLAEGETYYLPIVVTSTPTGYRYLITPIRVERKGSKVFFDDALRSTDKQFRLAKPAETAAAFDRELRARLAKLSPTTEQLTAQP